MPEGVSPTLEETKNGRKKINQPTLAAFELAIFESISEHIISVVNEFDNLFFGEGGNRKKKKYLDIDFMEFLGIISLLKC